MQREEIDKIGKNRQNKRQTKYKREIKMRYKQTELRDKQKCKTSKWKRQNKNERQSKRDTSK